MVATAAIRSAGSVAGSASDDDRQLVWAAKDDVDAGGKLAEDRCRLDVRPQSATQIDVEADLQPRVARQVARPDRGRGRSR